jgi:hypothetical protein
MLKCQLCGTQVTPEAPSERSVGSNGPAASRSSRLPWKALARVYRDSVKTLEKMLHSQWNLGHAAGIDEIKTKLQPVILELSLRVSDSEKRLAEYQAAGEVSVDNLVSNIQKVEEQAAELADKSKMVHAYNVPCTYGSDYCSVGDHAVYGSVCTECGCRILRED